MDFIKCFLASGVFYCTLPDNVSFKVSATDLRGNFYLKVVFKLHSFPTFLQQSAFNKASLRAITFTLKSTVKPWCDSNIASAQMCVCFLQRSISSQHLFFCSKHHINSYKSCQLLLLSTRLQCIVVSGTFQCIYLLLIHKSKQNKFS